ncbi:MAG TPA: prenyltransferase/squalene oxidase repeat-containing protein [Bryobacteraceae bacterium]|nr:prenyltransferase/squalene oxidase repeat-containing protein [Bryobacteraceae bacterium]
MGLYLESRLEFLRASQNPDGGWGYFPGKGSWLEPTTYALLALHGAAPEAWDRGWNLVRSWQNPDGSFRPSGEVADGTWVTALGLTLAEIRGVNDVGVHASIDWLLRVVGAEHNMWTRTGSFLHLIKAKLDVSHEGWPWREGNATWIEPTAHTLVALKCVAGGYRKAEVDARVRDGEALVLSRRCTDGGWNYGTPNMLYYDLPSYPETTGLALLGLVGRDEREYPGALDAAERFRASSKTSLGRAWLEIALRCHGRNTAAPEETARTSRDIMLAALEALGHPDGNYKLFTPGVRT